MYHRNESVSDNKFENETPADLMEIPLSYFANHPHSKLEFDVYSETGALLFEKNTPINDDGISKCIVTKTKLFKKIASPAEDEKLQTKIPQLVSKKQLQDMTQDTVEIFMEIEKSGKISKFAFDRSKSKFESLLEAIQIQDLTNTSLYLSSEMSKLEDYIYQHATMTGVLAMVFGMKLGIPDAQLMNLIQAAYYFDIGLSRVPKNIIRKKEPLTNKEKQIVQAHTRLGYALLHEFSLSAPEDMGLINAKLTSLLHHKKFNGKGYPYKKDFSSLKFNFSLDYTAIPQFTKIASICEMFTAMTSDRPYRTKFQTDQVLKKILNEALVSFDVKLVHNFINKMGLMLNNHKPFYKVGDFFLVQSEFQRKSGKTVYHEIGICSNINTDYLMSPQLFIVYNVEAKKKLNMIQIDLTKDPDRKIIKIIESQKSLDMLRTKLA
jgi:HD-GYP domain-containing protein (c-di-GMP phosphodiesterase class II)